MAEQPMYFKQLELGPMQNFIYLLGDPASREAAVVDPSEAAPPGAESWRLPCRSSNF